MKPAVLTGEYFMTGDVACAEGALAAGCRFFGGYPITPATEIAERMAIRLSHVDDRQKNPMQSTPRSSISWSTNNMAIY